MAFVWKNATKANPVEFGPDGHGWEISPDKLTIVWYTLHRRKCAKMPVD